MSLRCPPRRACGDAFVGPQRWLSGSIPRQGNTGSCVSRSAATRRAPTKLSFGRAGDTSPFEYTTGGAEAGSLAKPVVDGISSLGRVVVTRDLYADFGQSDLIDLTVSTVDKGAFLWDDCYLARTRADFERIDGLDHDALRETGRPRDP